MSKPPTTSMEIAAAFHRVRLDAKPRMRRIQQIQEMRFPVVRKSNIVRGGLWMNRLGTGAAGQEQAARGQNATGEESCRRECSHWHGAPIRFRRVETVKLAIPSQVYWEFCILHFKPAQIH